MPTSSSSHEEASLLLIVFLLIANLSPFISFSITPLLPHGKPFGCRTMGWKLPFVCLETIRYCDRNNLLISFSHNTPISTWFSRNTWGHDLIFGIRSYSAENSPFPSLTHMLTLACKTKKDLICVLALLRYHYHNLGPLRDAHLQDNLTTKKHKTHLWGASILVTQPCWLALRPPNHTDQYWARLS